MKKVFTLIVAAVMAASVSAQTFKSFTETTVFITNQENVTAGITAGWIAAGSGQTATTKTGSINPETGEEEVYRQPGIDLKKGNKAKTFTAYVTGLTGLTAYGATTGSSDSRDVYVVATPEDGGAAVEGSATSAPSVSAVVSIKLDATKKYTVEITGVKEGDNTAGADIALHGVKFVAAASSNATVTIGKEGVATFAASYPVDYNANNLEAYSVSYDATNNKLAFNKIDGVVAANTAVIVKGAAGDYTLAKATADATVTETGLMASDGKKTGAENIYCLANKSEGLGFYQVSSTVTIPANKAYLEIPASAGARTFYSMEFGGGTTGINTIQANGAKANAAIYSLSGQQVSKAYKGIVIVNGKKMIQK